MKLSGGRTLMIAFTAVSLLSCSPDSSSQSESPKPQAISFGEMPSVTAVHGDFMYVADRRGNAIAKIDPSSDEVVLEGNLSDVLDGRRDTIWDLDSAGDRLWATIPSAGRILQLDPETLEVVRQVRVAGHVSDLYAAADALWFTSGGRDGVAIGRIDASSGELLPRRRLGPENTHITDVVEFDGSVWMVTDFARYIDGGGPNPTFKVFAELWQLDPTSGEVVGKDSLGSTFTRGAVNPVIGDVEVGQDGLWMSRVHERRLVLVDPSDTELLMQFYVAIFEHPWEFEVLDGDLFVGDLNQDRVAHIDPETRERRLLTLPAQTSHIGSGFGSVWVPGFGAAPDGGGVVRLDATDFQDEG